MGVHTAVATVTATDGQEYDLPLGPGVSLPMAASYALGTAEIILSIAFLLGFYRTVSYGLALLVHTVTVLVSWRQLLDPWGLAKVGNHLWISTWPTWGAFAALYIMRGWDAYTVDARLRA